MWFAKIIKKFKIFKCSVPIIVYNEVVKNYNLDSPHTQPSIYKSNFYRVDREKNLETGIKDV